jgi:hypothetical protein
MHTPPEACWLGSAPHLVELRASTETDRAACLGEVISRRRLGEIERGTFVSLVATIGGKGCAAPPFGANEWGER